MICTKLEGCVDAELHHNRMANCDNNKETCIKSTDKRSNVKCEEKGKKYIYENTRKEHVISYKMDDGIIVNDATVQEGLNKCDYLLVVNSTEMIAILVELKGENVTKALHQIQASLTQYKTFFMKFGHVYGRAVVASATPNLKASPPYVKLVKQLKQDFNGNMKIVERQFKEKDVDLGVE